MSYAIVGGVPLLGALILLWRLAVVSGDLKQARDNVATYQSVLAAVKDENARINEVRASLLARLRQSIQAQADGATPAQLDALLDRVLSSPPTQKQLVPDHAATAGVSDNGA